MDNETLVIWLHINENRCYQKKMGGRSHRQLLFQHTKRIPGFWWRTQNKSYFGNACLSPTIHSTQPSLKGGLTSYCPLVGVCRATVKAWLYSLPWRTQGRRCVTTVPGLGHIWMILNTITRQRDRRVKTKLVSLRSHKHTTLWCVFLYHMLILQITVHSIFFLF